MMAQHLCEKPGCAVVVEVFLIREKLPKLIAVFTQHFMFWENHFSHNGYSRTDKEIWESLFIISKVIES